VQTINRRLSVRPSAGLLLACLILAVPASARWREDGKPAQVPAMAAAEWVH